MIKGDKVKLRFKSLRQLCLNSPIIYGFQNNIDKKTIKQLSIIFSTYTNKMSLTGTIKEYGAYIDNTRDRFLGVVFKNEYGTLDMMYFEKKDLLKIKE